MAARKNEDGRDAGEEIDILAMRLDGQLLGLPVLRVHDVLNPLPVARIPLAPESVAGSINLRGRIVTVLSLRRLLGLSGRDDLAKCMSAVIDNDGDPCALLADRIDEVLRIHEAEIERPPATLDAHWKRVCTGVCRRDGKLLILLDPDKLLSDA